jgi:transcriptional regulator with XRE-family HTH domain
MTRTKQTPSTETGFAKRLVRFRKASGLTQIQLAELIDSNQRTLSHYETGRGYPPAPTIAALAEALDVSADELLGLKRSRSRAKEMTEDQKRLWKKFQLLTTLPEKDQRAVIRMVNSLSKQAS